MEAPSDGGSAGAMIAEPAPLTLVRAPQQIVKNQNAEERIGCDGELQFRSCCGAELIPFSRLRSRAIVTLPFSTIIF